MTTIVETLADRMLNLVVPRARAGACPCGDAYYQFCYCNWATGAAMHKLCHTTCDCSSTVCGSCSAPIGYC
jgi:hypothetical protein